MRCILVVLLLHRENTHENYCCCYDCNSQSQRYTMGVATGGDDGDDGTLPGTKEAP